MKFRKYIPHKIKNLKKKFEAKILSYYIKNYNTYDDLLLNEKK